MKGKGFEFLCFVIFASVLLFFWAGPSMAAYTIIEAASPSYINSAYVSVAEPMNPALAPSGAISSSSNGTPFAEAIVAALASGSFAESVRGSNGLIENNYLEDADGIHAMFSSTLSGSSRGMINAVPGWILENSSSLAEYSMKITGGTGSLEADLIISLETNTYDVLPTHQIDLLDSDWNSLFHWQSGEDPGKYSILLDFDEVFYVRVFSENNLFKGIESIGQEYDHESSVSFNLDVVQPPVPVPIPASMLLFVSGVIGLLRLKNMEAAA